MKVREDEGGGIAAARQVKGKGAGILQKCFFSRSS